MATNIRSHLLRPSSGNPKQKASPNVGSTTRLPTPAYGSFCRSTCWSETVYFTTKNHKNINYHKVVIVVFVNYVEYNVTPIKIFSPEESVDHRSSALS